MIVFVCLTKLSSRSDRCSSTRSAVLSSAAAAAAVDGKFVATGSNGVNVRRSESAKEAGDALQKGERLVGAILMTSAKFSDFWTPLSAFSRNLPYKASLLHLLLGYPSPLPVQTS